MNDPTIPKKRRSVRQGNAGERKQRPGPALGRLIDYGDRIVMADHRGNTWSQAEARWVGGSFGFSSEGLEKGPRPWRFSPAGAVLEEGDDFIIDFIDGDHDQPFIRGGIRSTKPDTPDGYFNGEVVGQDPNRLRFRLQQRDTNGSQQHHFDVEAFASSGTVEVRVGGSRPGPKLRIQLDYVTGDIRIGSGGETERVPFGDALVRTVKALAEDIVTLGAAGTSGTPLPVLTPGAVTAVVDLTTSLAAGAPHLSNRVKVD